MRAVPETDLGTILRRLTGLSGSRVMDRPEPSTCRYLPLPVKVVRRDRVEMARPAEFPRQARSPRLEADLGDVDAPPVLSFPRRENLGVTDLALNLDPSLLLGGLA